MICLRRGNRLQEVDLECFADSRRGWVAMELAIVGVNLDPGSF